MSFSLALALGKWLFEKEHLIAVLLHVLVVISAIGVVHSSHQTRALYSELQSLQKSADDLDSEYERLLLEQSAWADYHRVDTLARAELGMTAPDAAEWILVHREPAK